MRDAAHGQSTAWARPSRADSQCDDAEPGSVLKLWAVTRLGLHSVVDVGSALLDELREKPTTDDETVPHRELGDRPQVKRFTVLGRAPPVPLAPHGKRGSVFGRR